MFIKDREQDLFYRMNPVCLHRRPSNGVLIVEGLRSLRVVTRLGSTFTPVSVLVSNVSIVGSLTEENRFPIFFNKFLSLVSIILFLNTMRM